MATGDIVRLTMRGHCADQEVVNVFHWKQTSSGSLDLAQLQTYFRDTFMSPIQTICSTGVSWDRLTWEQLVDGGVFLDTVLTTTINGIVTGDQLPPNVCWTFTYLRKVRGHRNGYKRFPGVPEAWQNGGVISTGHDAAMASAAAMLAADITTSGSVTYRPGVLHKELNGQPVIPPEFQEIAGVAFTGIGTQNTRKIGRGS